MMTAFEEGYFYNSFLKKLELEFSMAFLPYLEQYLMLMRLGIILFVNSPST